MGIFEGADFSKARSLSGGNFIDEPGEHEFEISNVKGFLTRKKVPAFSADFRVIKSDNPALTPGTVKNFVALSDDDFFASKVREFLIAATGRVDGLDNEEIAKTDWLKVLEAVCTNPKSLIGKKINASAQRQLKADGRKQAKANPDLLDDASWFKKNSFVKVTWYANDETRAARSTEKK
jgi:hypothetical protein